MRKILVLLLVLFSVATFGQGDVLKQGQKVLKRSGKILKSHYPWEYNEPSDWANIHYAKSGEALLLVNDSADRYIAFDCSTAGQYSVDVYGGIRADSLIYTQTLNTSVDFNYQMPLGKGKPYGSNGYHTYIVKIYPKITTKGITTITARAHPNSAGANHGILLANINIPTLSSILLSYSTGICKNIRYVNLYNCSNITSLNEAFRKCNSLFTVTFSKKLDYLTTLHSSFYSCTSLHHLIFPNKLNSLTSLYSSIRECPNIEYIIFPIEMNNMTTFYSTFYRSLKIKQIQYPLNMPLLNTLEYCNYENLSATYYRLPSNAPNITTLKLSFCNNYKVTYLKLPKVMNKVTTAESIVTNDTNLQSLFLPDSMILCTSLFNNKGLWNLDTISTCVWGSGQVNTEFTIRDLKTFKQPTLKVSKLVLRGNTLATKSQLHTINIDWANSTYGETTPQIDIRWNSLSATTINAIFTALPVVVGKTINVAGNPGSATCTPSIASLKGWTVIIL